jgi:hypothetical protein
MIHACQRSIVILKERCASAKSCAYCRSALEVFEHIQWDDPIEDDGIPEFTPDYARLAYCEYCGFWNWYSTVEVRGWRDNYAGWQLLEWQTADAAAHLGTLH